MKKEIENSIKIFVEIEKELKRVAQLNDILGVKDRNIYFDVYEDFICLFIVLDYYFFEVTIELNTSTDIIEKRGMDAAEISVSFNNIIENKEDVIKYTNFNQFYCIIKRQLQYVGFVEKQLNNFDLVNNSSVFSIETSNRSAEKDYMKVVYSLLSAINKITLEIRPVLKAHDDLNITPF